MKHRYLSELIKSDLAEKMVFIGGPRQVGKTTLAQYIASQYFTNFQYLNWDNRMDRKIILDSRLNPDAKLIIFDEIHKYKEWKNYLKGEYDKNKAQYKILVTGSSRLDIYRKGGDSLLGRYHYFRLHPFSLNEFLGHNQNIQIMQPLKFSSAKIENQEVLDLLLKFGGFPEPLLRQSEKTLRRWQNERIDRLIKEDIRDLESIRDLSLIQVLVELLEQKVGSLLSINSLREDLSVSHKSLTKWLEILEKFYFHFRIYPYQNNLIKSLKKEAKIYLWDWSEIKKPAAKIENIVASHLLKMCHLLYDWEGYKIKLYYLRDIDGREVDFLVTVDEKPWFSVEVKTADCKISTNINYFAKKINIPFNYQVVLEKNVDYVKDSIRVISLDKFLTGLI